MSIYIRREHFKPVIRFLLRIVLVTVLIFASTAIGLLCFLFWGGHSLSRFHKMLAILLLFEGSLIGVGGAFMFLGYSEYRVARQSALNPAIIGDQVARWRERRLSQQKWGVAMLVASLLLIFLGLLTSVLNSI